MRASRLTGAGSRSFTVSLAASLKTFFARSDSRSRISTSSANPPESVDEADPVETADPMETVEPAAGGSGLLTEPSLPATSRTGKVSRSPS